MNHLNRFLLLILCLLYLQPALINAQDDVSKLIAAMMGNTPMIEDLREEVKSHCCHRHQIRRHL